MTTQRGPYAKTPEVRSRIIQAATRIFASSGYRGTTMKEIASSCGLTAKGVAHHFASKDELLMAVLAERDLQVSPAPEAPSVSLDGLFDSLAQARREPRIVELYTVLSAEAIAPDHPAHEYHRERYERVRAELGQFFELQIAGSGAASDLPPVDLAALFVAVVDGLQIQWLYDAQAVDLERLARTFVRALVVADLKEAPQD